MFMLNKLDSTGCTAPNAGTIRYVTIQDGYSWQLVSFENISKLSFWFHSQRSQAFFIMQTKYSSLSMDALIPL